MQYVQYCVNKGTEYLLYGIVEKMKIMNKKAKLTSLTTATLATVLLAGANLSGNVKAATNEDVNANSTQKAQSPKEIAQDNIKNAQTKVDQAQSKVNTDSKNLDNAKKDAQAPDKAYDDQDVKVTAAQSDLNKKKDAQTNAQNEVNDAQKLVDQATDSNVAAAKKVVNDKSTEISNKQQDLKDTEAKVPAKQAAIDKANSDVNSAQTNLTTKTNAKSDADAAVKNAQDALNNTGINETNQAIETYKNNIKSLNDSITANQKTLEHNQDVLKDNQTKLDDINKQLPKATQSQKDAQQAVDDAKKALTNAQTQLAQDQDIANSAAGFFKSLAEDTSLTDEQREDARMAYSVVMNEGKAVPGYNVTFEDGKLNSPKVEFTEDNSQVVVNLPNGVTEFNYDTLTNGKGIKLAWYNNGVSLGQSDDATSLSSMKEALNDFDDWIKVRSEYNLSQPQISLTAVAIAMMSSDYLNSHNFDHPINHPEDGPFYGTEEDIAYGSSQVGLYMDEKEYIDNLIAEHPEYAQYRYDTGNLTEEQWNKNNEFWAAHGLTISGDGDQVIGHYISMIEPNKHSVGMAVSGPNSSTDIIGDTVSYPISVKIDHIDQEWGPEYKDDELHYPYDSFSISDYKNLVNSYNPENASFIQTDKTDIKDKQEDLKNKQKFLDTAKTNVTNLQNSIDEFNTAISNTKTAISDTQKAIKKAQDELPTQQSNLEKEKARLASLTVSNDTKTSNLQAALENQTKAQQDVEAAENKLTDAKNELTDANKAKSDLEQSIKNKQAAIEKAQSELKDLTAKRDALVNAPQTLKAAQSNLTAAKNAVTTAENTLKTEQDKLKELKAPKDEADAKVKQAQEAYDTANNELTDAKDKLTKAKDALSEIERQEQEAAELAAQEAQEQAEAAKKAAELKKAADEAQPVNLTHNAYVYDKDGKAITVNGETKTLTKGDSIKAYSKAKVVTIKGKEFYQIGENEFVKVANTVAKTNNSTKNTSVPKSVKLTHNAFIYDKNGKRVKLTWIKRGKTIKPTNMITIKGKKYYQIRNNSFVKVANTKVKTHTVKKTATIKAKLNHKVATVDRLGKNNGDYVLGSRTYSFNEKLVVNGKTYYKIAGKNDWVPASKLNLKK